MDDKILIIPVCYKTPLIDHPGFRRNLKPHRTKHSPAVMLEFERCSARPEEMARVRYRSSPTFLIPVDLTSPDGLDLGGCRYAGWT